LWTDITKQFLSHSSTDVLAQSVAVINHLLSVTSLSNANAEKILELEEELATSLRDVIAGRDELDMVSFSEDETLKLTAICTRLSILGGRRDLTAWADEDEGGKQSSAWNIVASLAERGRLGYKEEESVSETPSSRSKSLT
jgi:cohesin complex subunit SA-1/2